MDYVYVYVVVLIKMLYHKHAVHTAMNFAQMRAKQASVNHFLSLTHLHFLSLYMTHKLNVFNYDSAENSGVQIAI